MAPRPAARRKRDNDFSAVGRIGRRTGVTLPQGRIDENGLEEITGIFSSPRKPSPIKTRGGNAAAASSTSHDSEEMFGMDSTGLTPTQVLTRRKSLRGASIPRSSPARKTGINGDARRSQGADLFSPEKEMPQFDPEDRENTPAISPSPQTLQHPPRRFEPSPEKSPLRDITTMGARSAKGKAKAVERSVYNEFDRELERVSAEGNLDEYEQAVQSIEGTADGVDPQLWDDVGMPVDDQDEIDFRNHATLTEDLRESIEYPEARSGFVSKAQPTQANSRRKRKSDVIEEEVNPISSPTPEAKRHKVASKKSVVVSRPKTVSVPRAISSEIPERAPAEKGRPPKSKNEAQLSTRQQSELNEIIEKVKARPGQQKSLYILRRETPADDSVTHTRSGRVSVKPLAYWRNERCVYGGSPGGAQLADGARFPLNSIKEIVRTDEVEPAKKRIGGKKGKGKARRQHDESDSESDLDEPSSDPNAEEWELERGIFRAKTSVWDPQQQAPLDVDEEVDLAYAPAAIETREVKGSDFKYAKLLSTKFFGTGIVDLPAGAEKRPKNSRKMLMSFFVFKGRVTVQVGPFGQSQSTFSVGKGGFWTVPRGNQYGIKNELDKPARVFFSQGCEPSPFEEE